MRLLGVCVCALNAYTAVKDLILWVYAYGVTVRMLLKLVQFYYCLCNRIIQFLHKEIIIKNVYNFWSSLLLGWPLHTSHHVLILIAITVCWFGRCSCLGVLSLFLFITFFPFGKLNTDRNMTLAKYVLLWFRVTCISDLHRLKRVQTHYARQHTRARAHAVCGKQTVCMLILNMHTRAYFSCDQNC